MGVWTGVTLKSKFVHRSHVFTDPLAVIASSLVAIGLLLTILRLTYRIWLRRFWVEDAWAAVAFLCGISALTTCWTYVDGGKSIVLVDITRSPYIPICSGGSSSDIILDIFN